MGAIAGYLSLWSVYWLFAGHRQRGHGLRRFQAAGDAWCLGRLAGSALTILLSSVVGAVLGSILLRVQRAESSTPIPFGPYLAIAGWIALLWGDRITESYLQFARF